MVKLQLRHYGLDAQDLVSKRVCLLLEEGPESFGSMVQQHCLQMGFDVMAHLAGHNFTGKAGQATLLLAASSSEKQVLVIGVGRLDQTLHENLEIYRNALGIAIAKMREYRWQEAALILSRPEALKGLALQEWLADVVTSTTMATYHFKDFKTKANKDLEQRKDLELCLMLNNADTVDLPKALLEGQALGLAVNMTRQLANMPPNIAYPDYVAQQAVQAATTYGFDCKVFQRQQIEAMGMGGIMAVGSGSGHDCRLVELSLKANKPGAPTIALVGKGVTFDTGGVSLKPAKSMSGMKYDMAGAAAVLGCFQALAQLGAGVNVVGLMPLVENMPDGKACRQDDIITHYNGMTTEIDNTDAEGRLILADAIAYAEDKHAPDLIIDIATLTGACVVALGHFFTGMMSNNLEFSHKLQLVGDRVGEPVWPLPCISLYDRAVDSPVADSTNCGKPGFDAGAITAGMFLKRFVKKAAWIHLDIAGTEADIPVATYLGRGATGVGVRLLTKFIVQFNDKKA